MRIKSDGVILDDLGRPLLVGGKALQKTFVAGTTTTTTSQGTTTTTTAAGTTTTTTMAGGSGSSAGGDVLVEFTFNQAPTSASVNLLKSKYGKPLIYNFEIDDNPKHAYYFMAYLQGGLCGIDNVTYPGKSVSDGCGNQVFWRHAIACNVKNSYNDNFLMDPINGYNSITTSDLKELIKAGCVCTLHGYYHFDNPAAPPPDGYSQNGFSRSTNVSECAKYLWQNGNGYMPRYMVIPQDSSGYNVPLKAQGFLAQSSTGVTDGETEFPHPPELYNHQNIHINDLIAHYNAPGKYAAFRRAYIYDWTDAGQTGPELANIDYIISIASPDSPEMLRSFTHGLDGSQWNGARAFFESMATKCGDNIWFASLHEVLDYIETRRLVVKTETLSGNKLTVRLNYNQIPNENTWRDLSMKLNVVGASVMAITVKGAQGSSFNLSTGLVNVFNKRMAVAYPYSQNIGGGGTLSSGEIPYDPQHDIYLDNNHGYTDYSKLRDGDLLTNYVAADSDNLIYPNHDMVFNISRFRAKLSRVSISFGGGSGGATQTDILFVKADLTEVLVGTWTQNGYQQTDVFWYDQAGHTETAFEVQWVILRAKTNLSYGAEVKFYGTYQPLLTAPVTRPLTPIGYQAGWNIHPWYVCKNNPPSIVVPRIDAVLNMDMIYGGLRCYDDWYAVQDRDGKWRIGTEQRGFTMDDAYAYFKAHAPQMIKWRALQNQSLIIQDTWDKSFADTYIQGTVASYTDNGGWGGMTLHVTSVQGSGYYSRWHIYSGASKVDVADFGYTVGTNLIGQNLYFNVGGGKGYTNGQVLQLQRSQSSHVGVPLPADGNLIKNNFPVYDMVAQAAFVYASRLGKNTNVPDYPCVIDQYNQMTKGTDLCNVFEFGNEWNAFWTTWFGYWNGHDLFFAWSMMYDGHMGQYADRGIKQADPNAKMAFTGLASDKTDIPYAALEQTIRYRGKTPDGTWNVPFDVINVHMYSSAGGQYSGAQGGLPPEQGMLTQIRNLVWFRNTYLPTKEVWISEWGWDVNQGSPLAALAYGPYTDGRFVAAMWHVRAMLIFAKEGIDRAQCYRLYQDGNWDDNNSSQFATMAGLRPEYDDSDWSAPVYRTPVGDYFKQLQEFAAYTFEKEIPTGITGVYCWQFLNASGKRIMALWSEEVTSFVSGKPSFTERTGNFAIPVVSGSTIRVRIFANDGSGVMISNTVPTTGATYSLPYRALPKIIELNPSGVVKEPEPPQPTRIQRQPAITQNVQWALRINEREFDYTGMLKAYGGVFNSHASVANLLNSQFDLVNPITIHMLEALYNRPGIRAGFRMELKVYGQDKYYIVSLWNMNKITHEFLINDKGDQVL